MMSDTEIEFRSFEDYVSKYRRVLDYFDAFKVGLTATPALHTTDIFGKPVFSYSYREAVVDGYLIDHEPPYHIKTKLSKKGIHWKSGEQIKVFDPATGQLDLFRTPDELDFEVADFNKKVITESFNRVVCNYLSGEIDPGLPEKTLAFCANDRHADLVTRLLKEAFEKHYGAVEDDAVLKITGAADQPLKLIRRYRNERLPNVAVTVDLLTTGIDVHAICNLVFIRRVNSRILYEQMLGRATRRCDEIDKKVFRIFDAVDLYSTMQDYSDMKPVVNNPKIAFEKLEEEIASIADKELKKAALEQFIVKLRRSKARFSEEKLRDFETKTGMDPDGFLQWLVSSSADAAAQWFVANPGLGEILDRKCRTKPFPLVVSEHPDELKEVRKGFGDCEKPDDYIREFQNYIRNNENKVAALKLVLQRPRDLTRKQLRELRLALDKEGFREENLKAAYGTMTNAEIAAGIVGFIRQAALGMR